MSSNDFAGLQMAFLIAALIAIVHVISFNAGSKAACKSVGLEYTSNKCVQPATS